MNYAIVENGIVINTIEWDGVTPWLWPSGSTVVHIPNGADVGIGSTYDGTNFTAPPHPPSGL
ncbi:hypothetical protein LL999_22960 [Burkholderia ambifaria]|uniref:hypothetical protein n=1 Tax=Burkholderia ambifaria TaxID=152480 RepID=UPI001E3B77C7|nr:hypothetical protein [Burkholderia ambifaria]UEP23108.1 hypothetical protein LL999_22960 [Burkholderia ambifaria]